LRRFGIVAAAVWRRGQPTLTGRIRADSGFTVALGESEFPGEVSTAMLEFLGHYSGLFDALQRLNANVEIDILLPLRLSHAAARGMSFPANLLRLAGSLNVDLGVTSCIVEEEDRNGDRAKQPEKEDANG
ncbi:MAG: hypothetical protein QM473_01745, partial [Acidobacteriota bacterium]|nr:hypothetical protein [Acidobacteriota bacterium]